MNKNIILSIIVLLTLLLIPSSFAYNISQYAIAYYGFDGTNWYNDQLNTYDFVNPSNSNTTASVGKFGNGRNVTTNANMLTPSDERLLASTYTGYGTAQNGYTVSFWYKMGSVSGIRYILSGSNSDGSGLQNPMAFLTYNGGANEEISVRRGAGDTQQDLQTTSAETWYHGVIVVNITGNWFRVYINGAGKTQKTNTVTGDFDAGYPIALGGRGASNVMQGSLDEIVFWNRTLTPDEINWLYNGGTGRSFSSFNFTTPATNVTISVKDFYTTTSINNFSVYENDTILLTSTTTGTATLPYITNSTSLYNLTISSNENGGYFNNTLLNKNISVNIETTLSQSVNVFTARTKVSNTSISIATFNTSYVTNGTHYMRAGTYNVTATATSFVPVTFTYTATALSSVNTTLYLGNQSINITTKNPLTGATITGYTLTISNSTYAYSDTVFVTGNFYVFNLTGGISYTISVNKSSYISNTTNLSSFDTGVNFTTYLTPDNHLLYYFYDEETLNAVTNVTYQVVGTTYSVNGTTGSTSYANLSGLSVDNYELRYYKDGYRYRSLFFDIPNVNASLSISSAYMIQTANSSAFVVTVTDKNNRPIDGLVVDLLRRYPIGGTTQYYIVEMTKPNTALQGAAPFHAYPNNIPYLFRVRRLSDNQVLFQGAGTTSTNLQTLYLIESVFYIKVSAQADPFTAVRQLRGVEYSLTNTSNTFWLSVSDPNGVTSQNCLKIVKDRTTVISNNCSATASILGASYTPVNGSIYYAYYIARATADGKDYIIATSSADYSNYDSIDWGYTGVFIMLLTLMVIGIGFSDRPVVGVALGGVTITLFGLASLGSLIGLPSVSSALVSGSMLIISIILIVVMKEDR